MNKNSIALLLALCPVAFLIAQYDHTGDFTVNGDVGVGTDSPASMGSNLPTLDLRGGTTERTGGIKGASSDLSKSWSILRADDSSLPDGLVIRTGDSAPINFQTDGNNTRMSISGNGEIELFENMSLNDKKYIIEHGTYVNSEMFIAGHGQGAGWMVNAKYSGSGNPQQSATYSISPGQYNTGAGYLDFDGNGRMWSFFVSQGASTLGSPVNFKAVANFRYDQYINLSPTGNSYDFYLDHLGNVGIGTSTPDSKLVVDGTIKSEEVVVENVTGADYVFEEDYNLASLAEISQFIKANKHLPEVPSAQEIEENGLNLGEMNILLLKKVEELTLHVIQLNERIKKLETDSK